MDESSLKKELESLTEKELRDCIRTIAEYWKTVSCEKGSTGTDEWPSKQLTIRKPPRARSLKIANWKSPTLAQKYEEVIKKRRALPKFYRGPYPPIGWWISEKFDGIRCVWTGKHLVTRSGNIFNYVPQWFMDVLPPSIPLDGEIWAGRDPATAQAMHSICTLGGVNWKTKSIRDKRGYEKRWLSAVFLVFDSPSKDKLFEERLEVASKAVKDRCVCWRRVFKPFYQKKEIVVPDHCPLRLVRQEIVQSEEHLEEIYQNITGATPPGEGVMLRAPNSPYEESRTRLLLKWKPIEDAECKVIGYSSGTGRNAGRLGAFICQIIKNGVLVTNPNGTPKTFKMSGMSDAIRDTYKRTHPIGTIITYTYLCPTAEEIPYSPQYQRIRTDLPTPITADEAKELKEERKKTFFVKNPETGTFPVNQAIEREFNTMIQKVKRNRDAGGHFKIRNYEKVINIVKRLTFPITSRLVASTALKQGGMKNPKKILDKIKEIIEEGSLRAAQEARDDPVVRTVEVLTRVFGISPVKALNLYNNEGISTIEELVREVRNNPDLITGSSKLYLTYFDELQKRIPRENIAEWEELLSSLLGALSIVSAGGSRTPACLARLAHAQALTVGRESSGPRRLTESVRRACLVPLLPDADRGRMMGSYYRGNPTSGDMDFLIVSDNPQASKELVSKLQDLGLLLETLGGTGGRKGTYNLIVRLGEGRPARRLDIFLTTRALFPYAILHWTGPRTFEMWIRGVANQKGYKLSQRGLFKVGTDIPISAEEIRRKLGRDIETEEDIFEFLEIPYKAPNERR